MLDLTCIQQFNIVSKYKLYQHLKRVKTGQSAVHCLKLELNNKKNAKSMTWSSRMKT